MPQHTRVAVLKRLEDWFLGEAESEDIMRLYGDASAGKSAIAQTLAEVFAREKRLLGSFFFSRNDARRTTHNPLVATIAYQAATTIPELEEPIISTVGRDSYHSAMRAKRTLSCPRHTILGTCCATSLLRPHQIRKHSCILHPLPVCRTFFKDLFPLKLVHRQ